MNFDYVMAAHGVGGKGGGGSIIHESVTNLLSVSKDTGTEINVTWTNPTVAEFIKVELFTSTINLAMLDYEQTVANSTKVVDGVAQSYNKTVAVNTTHYFKAYVTYRTFGADVVSKGVTVSATATDTKPPGMITGFKASSGDATVTLNWINPADADFSKTKILYKTDGYPTGPTDGNLAYEGSGNTITLNGLSNDATCYFRAFTFDTSGNINSATAMQIEATPTAFRPDDPSGSPGANMLIAGDMQAGYFGRVPASELWTGTQLSAAVGISAGTIQHDTTDWLKFAYKGKILFRPMKAIRCAISWDNINAAGCVSGTKTITKSDLTFKVRLMKGVLTDPSVDVGGDMGAKGSEWNRLMLPIHEKAVNKNWAYPQYVEADIPSNWGINFTDADLLTHYSYGNGCYVWCQEVYGPNSANRLIRGYLGVSRAGAVSSSDVPPHCGWAPVLELV